MRRLSEWADKQARLQPPPRFPIWMWVVTAPIWIPIVASVFLFVVMTIAVGIAGVVSEAVIHKMDSEQ